MEDRNHAGGQKMANLKAFSVIVLSLVASLTIGQTLPPPDKVDVVLIIGQSNASGRGWPMNPEDSVTSPQVWRWWIDGLAYPNRPEPFGNDVPYVATGPGLAFGKEWVKRTGRDIIVVFASQGNTMLSDWEKGSSYYQRALDRVRPVMTSGTLVGIVWHQGEGDSIYQAEAATYGNRLTKMLTDLRQDIGREVPVVCGGLGDFLKPESFPYRNTINSTLANMPRRISKTTFVSADGLGHNDDRVHFSAAAQRELGTRYAAAISQFRTAAASDWQRYE